MRQSHLILLNTLIIWASRVLLLVPQVILVPFLLDTIGEAGYGVYALIWSLLMGIDRLERSLQSGVIKYSAAFLAEKRIDQVNRVVSSSFVYSILLAAVIAVGIFIAAFFCNSTDDLGISLFVVGFLVLLIIPLTPYVAVIQSRQRYYVGVLADTGAKYVTLAAVVLWFTLATPSVEALIIITAVALLLSRAIQVPVARRLVPGLRNRLGLFDREAFHLILAFGGMTVFISLCVIANTTGLRWLMGLLVSTRFVAHLAIMLMPAALLTQIVLAMTITVMPAASAYEATGNNRMLRELLLRSMRYTAIIVVPALLVAILLVKTVLTLWVGAEYAFLAPYTLALLASAAFLLVTSSAHHMLKGLGQLRVSVFIAMTGKVVVPLTLILIVFFVLRDPYLAVTVGLVTGDILSALLHIGFAVRVLHADFRQMLFRVYGQPLLAAAPVAASALASAYYGDIETLRGLAGIAMAATLLFLCGCYLLIATATERRQATDLLQLVAARIMTLWRKPKRAHS